MVIAPHRVFSRKVSPRNRYGPRIIASIALAFALTGCSSETQPEVRVGFVCAHVPWTCSGDEYLSGLLSLAEADLAAGRYDNAVLRLQTALQNRNDSAQIRFLLGRVLLEAGDPINAEREFRRAADLGLEAERVKPLIARSMIERGDSRLVLEQFPWEEMSEPKARADILVSRAYAHLALGETSVARAALKQSFDAQPGYPRALVALALVRAHAGEFEEAAADLETALAAEPNSDQAIRVKAHLARIRGHNEAAIAGYRRLIEMRAWDVMAHYWATNLLLKSGRIAEAQEQYQGMRKQAGNHPIAYHLGALLALRERNIGAALANIAKAVELAPGFGPSLLLSGILNAEHGSTSIADQHLARVLELNPRNTDAERARITVLVRTGLRDQAAERVRGMLRTAPNDPRVLLAAAEAQLELGAPEAAETLVARALDAFKAGASDKSRPENISIEPVDPVADSSALVAEPGEIRRHLTRILQHYIDRGRFDRALAVADLIERLQPGQRAAVLAMRGRLLAAAGQPSKAREVLEQALIARPGTVAALVELAQLDVAEGNPDAARSRIEQALTREPTHADLLIAYAQWMQVSGAPAERVRQQFERAVAAAPKDPTARVALAKFHSRTDDNARAVAVMQEAIAALPGNAVLLAQLGEAQARAGDLASAAGTLAQATEASGDAPDLLLALADVQMHQDAVDAARATLRKVLANRTGHVPAVERLVGLELRAKRPAEAVAAARELQQAVPREPAGYLLEAEVFARGGNFEAAIRICRAAMKESDSPRFAVALHRLLEQSGRKLQAERFVAEWSASHPRDATMQTYLAHAALVRQDYAEAVRRYRKLVEDFPNDADALNNLAWLAHRSGDRNAAGYAERAVRLAPSNPMALDTLGWILVEQGRLDRGLVLLRMAAARAPNNAEIRFNLARALLKAGNTGEARSELDRLVRLGKAFAQQAEVARLRTGL